MGSPVLQLGRRERVNITKQIILNPCETRREGFLLTLTAHVWPFRRMVFRTMAFPTFLILGLSSFPLLTSAQSNGFVFPPTAGPDNAIVGDSHLTFEIGETINLEWATNSTSLLSLIAFQGPRDPPDRGVYNLTLIGYCLL